MSRVAVFIFALFLSHGAYADLEEAPGDDKMYDSYRLPTSITPENYKLEVITHLNDTEGFIFRGVVWITVSEVLISVMQQKIFRA